MEIMVNTLDNLSMTFSFYIRAMTGVFVWRMICVSLTRPFEQITKVLNVLSVNIHSFMTERTPSADEDCNEVKSS